MSIRGVVIVALIVAVAVWITVVTTRAEPIGEVSAKWAQSGHADRTAEAFTFWNDDDPPVIPPRCAGCHSLNGHLDQLGADGTAAGSVEEPQPVGSVVSCVACHNGAAARLAAVPFPSGVEVPELDDESQCLMCHQGLAYTGDVEEAIAGLPLDEVNPELGFINVHYAVAAATQAGGEASGAYQYQGREYAGRYLHFSGLRTCAQCHDPHSLRLTPKQCSPCHVNVVDFADLRDIRNSTVDYDGDGSTSEGIAAEIQTFHDAVYAGLQAYARDVIGTPLVYTPGSFPYFVVDTNGDGEAQPDEMSGGNAYRTWTPRLVRVAYNYHMVHEDRGAFAHNPAYTLQFLYDSLADLGERVPVPIEGFTRP